MQHSGAENSFGYHCTDAIFFQIFIFFLYLWRFLRSEVSSSQVNTSQAEQTCDR